MPLGVRDEFGRRHSMTYIFLQCCLRVPAGTRSLCGQITRLEVRGLRRMMYAARMEPSDLSTKTVSGASRLVAWYLVCGCLESVYF